jgi:hypothetical protein
MRGLKIIVFIFCLLGPKSASASFDLQRLPTPQDAEVIRAMGWSAAADVLESQLAEKWKPSHFAQAGSAGNATFRQWQLISQWCRLLGTPEQEHLRSFLGRRVFDHPEKDNGLMVVGPGLPLPSDRTGRFLSDAAEKLDVSVVPAAILQALLPDDYTPQSGPVANHASADLLIRFAFDTEFLREFFRSLAPDDFAPMVVKRLGQLHEAHPNKWPDYRSLMLAFALVYDQRQPDFWPHHQVKPAAVPGMDDGLADRFGYYVQANDRRRLEYDLTRLSASELKFVVDAPVSRSELEWAAQQVRVRSDQFDRAFSLVNYDDRRAKSGVFVWPHADYRLETIIKQGGICVDQAYFACLAGKARGIPTIYFAGQGTDGGHAWFGYLQRYGKWDLDAGRYLNQNYTVGQALDPQTWLPITDHELLYLSGRATKAPTHDAALGDLAMAEVFRRQGDFEREQQAAESALHCAPGFVAAWDACEDALIRTEDIAALQKLYENAIVHFRREDDLRIRYQTKLAELVRATGDGRGADLIEGRMVRENIRKRSDLSTATGAEAMSRFIAAGDYPAAEREFRSLTGKLGRSGGGNLFYDVVRPFVLQLQAAGKNKEAERALRQARRDMPVEADSILAREFDELERSLEAR